MNTNAQEWTVLSMLEWGTDYFKKKRIPDPRLSIEWLIADILHIKRLDLYLQFDRPLSSNELQALRPLVKRRAAHEPLQHITGWCDFMHARIEVTPDVLIPRIETEQLVEILLDEHPSGSSLSVLDIGTGSGCIPIALKMERPGWDVTALDISSPALAMAKENAAKNNVDIQFQKGDITHWQNIVFDNPFDIIISNPPYILPKEKETLEPQVKKYEPALALFCNSIENMYGNVVACSHQHLAKKGKLYLEIHEHYADTISTLFDAQKWRHTLRKDYEHKPRFILAQKKDIH